MMTAYGCQWVRVQPHCGTGNDVTSLPPAAALPVHERTVQYDHPSANVYSRPRMLQDTHHVMYVPPHYQAGEHLIRRARTVYINSACLHDMPLLLMNYAMLLSGSWLGLSCSARIIMCAHEQGRFTTRGTAKTYSAHKRRLLVLCGSKTVGRRSIWRSKHVISRQAWHSLSIGTNGKTTSSLKLQAQWVLRCSCPCLCCAP